MGTSLKFVLKSSEANLWQFATLSPMFLELDSVRKMANDSVAKALIDATAIARENFLAEDLEDEIWPLVQEAAKFERDALEAGVELLSGDPAMRLVGCDLLGLLCNPDEHGWSSEVAAALIELAKSEVDGKVCDALSIAMGHTADKDCVPSLIGLSNHRESYVRRSAVSALPFCAGGTDAPVSMVETLLSRMDDEDGGVRDWATFGLSRLLPIDSVTIRDAFVEHLDDNDQDAQIEAVMGLARRRDLRAIPALTELLRSGGDDSTVLLAARYLADHRLLPYLVAIELDEGDYRNVRLAAAIRACDPLESAFDASMMTDLVAKLDDSLHDRYPVYRFGISCELLSLNTLIHVFAESSEELCWSYEDFMRRANGDIEEAVANVLADIRRSNRTPN
jgi:HEAT repeat protein